MPAQQRNGTTVHGTPALGAAHPLAAHALMVSIPFPLQRPGLGHSAVRGGSVPRGPATWTSVAHGTPLRATT